jgi:ABC-type nitrate/sulfonate/bicarbonate transport system substrate-binding protein
VSAPPGLLEDDVTIWTRRARPAVIVALVAMFALSGCGAGGAAEQGASVAAVPAGAALDLAGTCPAKVVIQAGWFPTADVALPFQLFGGDYRIDANRKRVTGSLVVGGKDTGVDLEYRSGGPAVGFQNGPALAYTDPAITMVFTNIDEMIATAAKAPMQAVIAPVNGDPQAIIFDPKSYPDFNSLADIGQTDTKVFYSANAQAAFGYLLGAGLLRPSQLDSSYDGSPSQFVAARGAAAVQGYATNEVYVYQQLPQWKKPVSYFLIQDSGYPNYAGVLSIRPKDKTALAPCLRKLVPVFQQAQIDMWSNPEPAAARIVKAVAGFESFFTYGPGNARFGFCQLQNEGLVSNPNDGPLGSMQATKVDKVLNILKPIFTGQKTTGLPGLQRADIPQDLTADGLATNEFLDPTLRLPSKAPGYYSTCTRTATTR